VERQYSIAEARNNLPGIVHAVEKGQPVELTRRGKPVAVLVSIEEYRRMRPTERRGIGAAMDEWRRKHDPEALGITGHEWDDVRDKSPGRDFSFDP
jgi:antitoxin Phd